MNLDLPEKLYYSIGEIAEAFGVKTSLLRFWEKEFELLKPKKNTMFMMKIILLKLVIKFQSLSLNRFQRQKDLKSKLSSPSRTKNLSTTLTDAINNADIKGNKIHNSIYYSPLRF